MRLSDFISEEAICMDLQEIDRDKAIRELLERLVSCGKITKSQVESVFLSIVKREELGTTAIGHNIAVPHARSDVLADIRMAIGMSKQGVDFQALDGKPVKAIFLIVAPHSKADEYIEVMKAVSQLVQTEDFRNFLFQSRNAGDIIELLDEMSS